MGALGAGAGDTADLAGLKQHSFDKYLSWTPEEPGEGSAPSPRPHGTLGGARRWADSGRPQRCPRRNTGDGVGPVARPPVTQQQTGRRPMPCPKADPSAHQSQYLRSGGKGGTCEQATRPAGSRPGPSAAALLPEASQGCPGPACSTRILRLPPRGGGARSGRVGSEHLSRRPPGPPASDCRCPRPPTDQDITPGARFLATRAGRTVTDAETEAQRQSSARRDAARTPRQSPASHSRRAVSKGTAGPLSSLSGGQWMTWMARDLGVLPRQDLCPPRHSTRAILEPDAGLAAGSLAGTGDLGPRWPGCRPLPAPGSACPAS